MGFFQSLAKGFVRSAVNQVGRDGGKVISNQIYKGAHSTPISGTYARQTYAHSAPIPKSTNVFFNVFMFGLWVFVLPNILISTFVSVFAFVIPVFFIKRLWRPLFKTSVHPKVSQAVYKSDRRYKTGARQVGSEMVTDTSINVPLEPSEIRTYRVEGIIKLIIFVSSYFFMYSTTKTADFRLSNMTTNEKLSILQAGDTLYKHSKFVYFYALIDDAGKRFHQIGYDTLSTYVTFLGVDSVQTNHDNRVGEQKVKGSPVYRDFKAEYEVMFRVKPEYEPVLSYSNDIYAKKRINKNWYLKPGDLNVGKEKLKLLTN